MLEIALHTFCKHVTTAQKDLSQLVLNFQDKKLAHSERASIQQLHVPKMSRLVKCISSISMMGNYKQY